MQTHRHFTGVESDTAKRCPSPLVPGFRSEWQAARQRDPKSGIGGAVGEASVKVLDNVAQRGSTFGWQSQMLSKAPEDKSAPKDFAELRFVSLRVVVSGAGRKWQVLLSRFRRLSGLHICTPYDVFCENREHTYRRVPKWGGGDKR